MDSKKICKNIGYLFGWFTLNLCSLTVRFLPQKWLYSTAETFAAVAYRILGKQRRIALNRLTIAFGREKTEQEREAIARKCFAYIAKGGFVLLFLMERPQDLRKHVRLVYAERLDACLAKGKGVILVSAHFGNFPLMVCKLSLEGYPTAGIMRPMRDFRAERFFNLRRERFKVTTIYSYPRRTCVENTIRRLRRNEIIFIPVNLPYLLTTPEVSEVFGLDISIGQLNRCSSLIRRKGWFVDLFLGNGEELPFHDDSFDSVFHIGGINFFTNQKKAIDEMIRVAKPGSKLIICDENESGAQWYEKFLPGFKAAFNGQRKEIIAPVDFVPASMLDLKLEDIWNGFMYCLEFRKPILIH